MTFKLCYNHFMKFAKILILIIILGIPLNSWAAEIKLAPQEIIDDYLDMADNYAFAGDYQKALDYINMVVHFEPMNSTAKYKQAMLLTTLNKTEEAKEIFAEAIKLNPKFANSELAAMLLKDNNPPKAEPAQSVQIQQHPQELSVKETFENTFGTEAKEQPKPYSSEYYNQLGLQYLNDGDNKTAYEYLKKAVELDKKNFDAHNNLGLFYWQQGENKLAEQQFKKAAKIDPKSSKPLLNLGLLYKEMHKDKKYYDNINKAVTMNPKDYLSNWIMGNYYAETARLTHAINFYKKAIDYNPNFYDGYLSLGNALAHAQKFDEAYSVFEKALTINSTDPNLYYVLSRTASVLGKTLDAKQYILQGLEIAQTDKLLLELAKVTSSMGDYEEALQILLKYFANTNEPEILNYIGLAYYKLKQPEIAIDYFKKLINIDKSKTIYFYNLALCYKSLGDRDKFFKYVDMATKILPKYPQDYIDLSYIYFDNGNKSYALNILNDGILKYPDDKKIYLAKLSLFQTCGDTKNYVEFKSVIDAKFGTK